MLYSVVGHLASRRFTGDCNIHVYTCVYTRIRMYIHMSINAQLPCMVLKVYIKKGSAGKYGTQVRM
jgi:hypothetical protein